MKIILITKKGVIKKVDLEQFRIQGRGAKGLNAIRLDEGDEIVFAQTIDDKLDPQPKVE